LGGSPFPLWSRFVDPESQFEYHGRIVESNREYLRGGLTHDLLEFRERLQSDSFGMVGINVVIDPDFDSEPKFPFDAAIDDGSIVHGFAWEHNVFTVEITESDVVDDLGDESLVIADSDPVPMSHFRSRSTGLVARA